MKPLLAVSSTIAIFWLVAFPIQVCYGKSCPKEEETYDSCIEALNAESENSIFPSFSALLCSSKMTEVETSLAGLIGGPDSVVVTFPGCQSVNRLLCYAIVNNCGSCADEAERWKACQWSDLYNEECNIDCECARIEDEYERCLEYQLPENSTCPDCMDELEILKDDNLNCSDIEGGRICQEIVDCDCDPCTGIIARMLECDYGCSLSCATDDDFSLSSKEVPSKAFAKREIVVSILTMVCVVSFILFIA